jgi:hypothetical protein
MPFIPMESVRRWQNMPKKKLDKIDKMIATRKAPLVQADIMELGDKRLNPAENVKRQEEELLQKASKFKIGRQEELEDAERSSGPRLQFTEVISRLRSEIPSLKAVDSQGGGHIALYVPRNRQEFEEAKREWDGSRDEFFLFHKYVGGFPKAELPEYDSITIDTSHLPTRTRNAWRSLLISLLKQGVISYRGTIRQFGEAYGSRAWRWQEQTKLWRQTPDKMFAKASLESGSVRSYDQNILDRQEQ